MPALPPDPPERRNEQHRCGHCGSRFEIEHGGNPMGTYVNVEVHCPCCGAATPVSLPRGAEQGMKVENLQGMEPETGAGD